MSSHDHGSRKSLGTASNARGDPAAATNHGWLDEDPVCIFNGIVSKMFTTFHRTPLCMSLGHEAEQIRERPTIPSIHTEPEHSPLRRLLCLGCLRGRCSTFMAFIARGYFHPPSIVVAPVKFCCVAVKLLTVFSSCLVL